MDKITNAVLAEKMDNLKEDVAIIQKDVKTTNGHVVNNVLAIARHDEQIKAIDKKAEQACIRARSAEQVSKSYLKWIITVVLGNILMFATVLSFLALTRL